MGGCMPGDVDVFGYCSARFLGGLPAYPDGRFSVFGPEALENPFGMGG